MKKLHIVLIGQGEFTRKFRERITALGHSVQHRVDVKSEEVLLACDYIFFLDFPDFSWISTRQNLIKKIIVFISQDDEAQFVWLNSLQTGTVLAEGPAEQNEDTLELGVDAVISLSRGNFSENNLISINFHENGKNYLPHNTIHQLFEQQVEKYPNNIALIYENKKLTYEDLNKQANQLANLLSNDYQVKPGDFVALYLDRSEYVIIAILAILKTGAAYVPISPDVPHERANYILKDSQPKLIITHEKYRYFSFKNVFFIDSPSIHACLLKHSITNPTTNLTNDQLAYIIYTSGTTGLPKGVLQPHVNVLRLFSATDDWYQFNEKDIWTLFHSYVFDFSVWEIWGALLYGGKLIIPSIEQIKDLSLFYNLCHKEKVTVLNQTPAAFYQFMDIAIKNFPHNKLTYLKYVIFGGEALNFGSLRPWLNTYGYEHPELINMYGITETTVHVTYKKIEKKDILKSSYIGVPIPDQKLYILDDNLSPLPIGAIGELYVGGAGLAKGYLNQPDLTKAKFISNIFQTEKEKLENKNDRLYKTGDLVRLLPNGELEYIGRNDFQVKIRGYRIELSEIENRLSSYEGIKQSVVMIKSLTEEETSESKYLIGYYVSEEKILEQNIKKYLSEFLPDYMVPNVFIHLKTMPLTVNGKIDRQALSQLVEEKNKLSKIENEYEAYIANLWGKLLKVKNCIDRDDNFFSLGGNSLLIYKILNEVRNTFGVSLKPKDIFDNLTVSAFASKLSDSIKNLKFQENTIYPPVVAKNDEIFNPFSCTPVQQAYLIGRESFLVLGNVSTHIYLEFEFDYLDVNRLEMAWNKLLNRHLSLRTTFKDGMQKFVKDFPYYKIIVREDGSSLREEMSHQIFDPQVYPLFNIVVSKKLESYILHISLDVLITDVYSLNILFTELTKAYRDPEIQLPSFEISFRDYVLTLEQVRQSDQYFSAKKYWENKIPLMPVAPSVPLVMDPAKVEKPRFSQLKKLISSELWQMFKKKAVSNNISPTTAILTIYGLVLQHWSNDSRFLINLTLFDRLPLHRDVDHLVGDFTTLELFTYENVQKDNSFNSICLYIQENLWEDLHNKLYTGVEVARELRRENNLNSDQLIAPFVFTSALGHEVYKKDFLDKGFKRINYRSAQTSQIYIDNIAWEENGDLLIEWFYVDQLFDKETIQKMYEDYYRLIEYFSHFDWKNSIPAFQLSDRDKYIIDSANDYLQESAVKTLTSLFELQAQKDPAATAIIDKEGAYSYKDICRKSECLSRLLYQKGAEKNKLIAVLAEKGWQQVVAVLGIMKSGSAYLPLQAEWPLGRVEEILTEGLVKLLVVSKNQFKKIKNTSLINQYEIIILEEMKDEYNLLPMPPAPELDDLAYVIFTSGSTGKPKGVMIDHKGAVNTIQAVNKQFHIHENDKVLALSELSFDLSVYDIFGLLAAGGTIVFPDQDKTKEPAHWHQLVKQHHITVWNTVPQLMQLLIDHIKENENSLDSLRVVLMSGDWIPLSLPHKIKSSLPAAAVMSLGGATEGSIWSIWYEIKDIDTNWLSIPYGKAMPNQKMYILNDFGEHAPVGVAGEIYIGGAGVALGYWQDEVKTNKSFVYHPTLGKIYKTGDLGRWSSAGYIEFLGRKDSQVKLNGYRVELEEISTKILAHPEVSDAIVIAKSHGGRNYLVAYYIATHEISPFDFDNYLKNSLPSYMLPQYWLKLDRLPLSANGKLDIKSLPDPDFKNIEEKYVAPRNELEEKICKIWQKLLSVEKVGIQDDFFKIGGESISSIYLVIQLRDVGLYCDVKDIFEYRTIEKLMAHLQINSVKNIEKINNIVLPLSDKLLKKLYDQYDIEAIYPAMSLHQGFISHALAYPQDDAYHEQIIIEYHSHIDVVNLKKAWECIIKTFPILRTCFNWEEALIQIIVKQGNLNWFEYDISNEENQAEIIQDIISKDRVLSFDLTQPSILRLFIIKQAEDKYTFIISEHHAIADGWTLSVLLHKLDDYYNEIMAGRLPVVKEDCAYEAAQKYFYTNQETAISYWKNKLNTSTVANNLSSLLTSSVDLDQVKTIKDNHQQKLVIEGAFYEQLKILVQKEGITLNTLLQFAWHKLIQIYTRDAQTIVGTTVSGRNIPIDGIEESIGMYINTLPVVLNWGDVTVHEQLQNIHREMNDLNTYSYVNLADIQSEGRRLFHSLFISANYPNFDNHDNSPLCPILKGTVEKLDYPLAILAYEKNKKLHIQLRYAAEYVTADHANKLLKQINLILEQLPITLEKPHHKINLIDENECNQLKEWNATDLLSIRDKTVTEMFEEQVRQTPTSVAVSFEENNLSYQQINEMANKLARYLRQAYYLKNHQELKPDTLIGVYVDRTPISIISILAVLKAGGAYMPLDPNHPSDRIKQIINDSQVQFLITQDSLSKKLPSFLYESNKFFLINYEKDLSSIQLMESGNLGLPQSSMDLAYVIYTSGSTGVPKGIVLEHKTLTNLISWQTLSFSGKKQTVAQFTNISFDVSIQEVMYALLNGHTLEIIPDSIKKSPAEVLRLLIKKKINTLFMCTLMLEYLVQEIMLSSPELPHLNKIIVAGEALKISKTIRTFFEKYPHIVLENQYGPSETHVVTHYTLSQNSKDWPIFPPIGKPIANTKIYLLDSFLQPVPAGVIGEIYISGLGLARGYLNRPDLTNERFILNPFADTIEKANGYSYLYKTGDLAKWLSDGNIEYVDRNDFQIKIRGYRIEKGEIEKVLSTYPDIKQSAIVVKERKDYKYLVAYYIASRPINEETLKQYLAVSLPEYMVPSFFMSLNEFPLTINGKLNTKALPEPLYLVNNNNYVAPRNSLEEKLCKIWQDVLNIEKIGINDDFAHLGGNSILAIQLTMQIKEILKYEIKLVELFSLKTIKNISELIEKKYKSLIVPMNEMTLKNKNLFMIHPGHSGCEVYRNLVDKLSSEYHCYGVDNYNLYQENKIDNLSELAELYLSQIKQYHHSDDPYFLLGWSLGGQIALEIATLLEKEGCREITVYLLDTVITDPNLKNFDSFFNSIECRKKFEYSLHQANYNMTYIQQVMSAYLPERAIFNSSLSGHLQYTKVILFKALQEDKTRIALTETHGATIKYILSLKDNNVSQYCSHFDVINVEASHSTIIDSATIGKRLLSPPGEQVVGSAEQAA